MDSYWWINSCAKFKQHHSDSYVVSIWNVKKKFFLNYFSWSLLLKYKSLEKFFWWCYTKIQLVIISTKNIRCYFFYYLLWNWFNKRSYRKLSLEVSATDFNIKFSISQERTFGRVFSDVADSLISSRKRVVWTPVISTVDSKIILALVIILDIFLWFDC